jgi:hypothetical protein
MRGGDGAAGTAPPPVLCVKILNPDALGPDFELSCTRCGGTPGLLLCWEAIRYLQFIELGGVDAPPAGPKG